MNKQTIVFTGGGSAGHVTPNIAIINELSKDEWTIHYIGSKKGIEKELISKMGIPYNSISSGKLRRYMDAENLKDIFRVLKGIMEARSLLKKIKPKLIFSKGGFVSVPVIIAASSLKIPIYIHESDLTPGLANKISQRFASKIFTSFEEAAKYFPANKTVVIGSPIRREIFSGKKERGKRYLDFTKDLPILTVMGGSLGAKKMNETVRDSLEMLTANYQIVHLCGKGQKDDSLDNTPGYRQFEYVNEELPDILAATDTVVTRGGSNAIFEFLALKIPMLIIPLTKKQSRGDQILNAQAFSKKGYALTLEEEKLSKHSLIQSLENLEKNKEKIISTMETSPMGDALSVLIKEIERNR
ncbi:undecaprenyldiphospho-muramoylpentapeptide beta-N-acetylglucosaminyltransferase [Bacillus sp. ISL-47]|uniref:undecaprenyldiphospho-muramoylpentapeptide beta-N-acetylglucosaminyltransferase n=1 Tax=Bacillus sp. ISL-47 TaxID=2819130 RepID=UPI001BE5F472|nr:undecaprenyldiphospho-muramoylpentapeptide beta-N-acetylglucosaminyltransferase [Bacillus sp. ISL-47]MBT2689718.1 undecaprenyldiphospho-muramoylpentapeptide beta-N-acetylglucosaminyltransferase [Bacillus sp. ISL-47]MBT2709991.1 undecaprenyldiphospho-muramoylpentapeptide beta-N-acetylglucosaminyltransferase [Pseudomonas sp. ISL-84]